MRAILPEERIHPSIRDHLSELNADLVAEVEQAIANNAVVVLGMAQNPFPKKARKALDEAGVAYQYLEYGNYFKLWRRRNALKMWTGWPTFPMIFVKGQFIGGFNQLNELMGSGALAELLSADGASA